MLNKITPPSTPVLIENLGMQFATENSKRKHRFGIYKCSCGKEFRAIMSAADRGIIKSCGCFQRQSVKISCTKHGLHGHKLYFVWHGIIQRLTNPKCSGFEQYGGRGITVCDHWKKVENFIEDMLPTWKDGLSIDRIDVNGNYEPSNCRWANADLQSMNTTLIHANNKSGYRGVSWDNSRKKWVSQIRFYNTAKHLGRFNTSLDAAKAYDSFVIRNNLPHPTNGVLFSLIDL